MRLDIRQTRLHFGKGVAFLEPVVHLAVQELYVIPVPLSFQLQLYFLGSLARMQHFLNRQY